MACARELQRLGHEDWVLYEASAVAGGHAGSEVDAAGFTSVINLRRDGEPGVDIAASRRAAEAAGLNYVHVPVDGANPSAESVDAFLRAVTDTSNQPMYIHCGSANRVGAFWLIKRVVVDGWDVEKATREAEAIGLTSPV